MAGDPAPLELRYELEGIFFYLNQLFYTAALRGYDRQRALGAYEGVDLRRSEVLEGVPLEDGRIGVEKEALGAIIIGVLRLSGIVSLLQECDGVLALLLIHRQRAQVLLHTAKGLHALWVEGVLEGVLASLDLVLVDDGRCPAVAGIRAQPAIQRRNDLLDIFLRVIVIGVLVLILPRRIFVLVMLLGRRLLLTDLLLRVVYQKTLVACDRTHDLILIVTAALFCTLFGYLLKLGRIRRDLVWKDCRGSVCRGGCHCSSRYLVIIEREIDLAVVVVQHGLVVDAESRAAPVLRAALALRVIGPHGKLQLAGYLVPARDQPAADGHWLL